MKRVVVIGGGIAGISAAAHLAPVADVTLLEMEGSLSYHTTGRSAATFIENYGGRGSRPLATASKAFLENPPPGSTDGPLLSPRGALWIATEQQLDEMTEIAETGKASGADTQRLDAADVRALVPAIKDDYVAGGLWEPTARDIDVAALHQAFVRIARAAGAVIQTSSPAVAIQRTGSGWTVESPDKTHRCDVVVNAAGAWGDSIAELAGIASIGLVPMRRTAFMVPGSDSYKNWPMVVDVGEGFYFRPDGEQLLCSLAEEVPASPGDPKAIMEDVALAIERINTATTLAIRSVNSNWAGLRTFAPDRDMVIGEDPTAEGFFWLVGQGGTGIMTSPAYGMLLASQMMGEDPPPSLAAAKVDPAVTHPARFR